MRLHLETNRLYLEPLRQQDYELFAKMLRDPFIRKYLCDDVILGNEIIQGFIDSSTQSFDLNSYGLWLIKDKHTAQIYGFAGLRTFFDEAQPQLLYALFEAFTGNGYAKEASEKIIEYSFDTLQFTYLIASCDAPNLPSQQLALSLGMKLFKEEEKEGALTLFYKIEQDA